MAQWVEDRHLSSTGEIHPNPQGGYLKYLSPWKSTFLVSCNKFVLCRHGSVVEHILGKNEVMGPIPIVGSLKKSDPSGRYFFNLTQCMESDLRSMQW